MGVHLLVLPFKMGIYRKRKVHGIGSSLLFAGYRGCILPCHAPTRLVFGVSQLHLTKNSRHILYAGCFRYQIYSILVFLLTTAPIQSPRQFPASVHLPVPSDPHNFLACPAILRKIPDPFYSAAGAPCSPRNPSRSSVSVSLPE